MSYSPLLGSSFNRTKLRDPQHVSTFSGMCSMCTADCVGTCEIGISAVRGADAVYPTTTGDLKRYTPSIILTLISMVVYLVQLVQKRTLTKRQSVM